MIEPAVLVGQVTATVLQGLARGERPEPPAIALLVRQYASTGRPDLAEALEGTLARALAWALEPAEAKHRHAWIGALARATSVSDDERLSDLVATLARGLASEWPARGTVAAAMNAIAACLEAAPLVGDAGLVGRAVEELERIIGLVYEPGEGVAHVIGGRERDPGELDDHLAAAAALLSAYELTGRLPYPMLADDLIRYVRSVRWDAASGAFSGSFADNCDAARVLCRLAMLHADRDYRAAAVVAPETDHAADAQRIVERLSPLWPEHGGEAARFAIAVDDLGAYDKIQRRL